MPTDLSLLTTESVAAARERSFFKYVSRETAKAVLSNNTLRWFSPFLFNDPFDIQFDLHVEVNREAVKSKALHLLWHLIHSDKPAPNENVLGKAIAARRNTLRKVPFQEFQIKVGNLIDSGLDELSNILLPEFHQTMRNVYGLAKILCFSEIDDNILMWSHYAEQHRGLVLKFRHMEDSAWGAAMPVIYTKEMPRLVEEDDLINMLGGQFSIDPVEVAQRTVYTKALDWAYEREWRIWFGRGRSKGDAYEDLPFDPEELEAVYFGCGMAAENRRDFAALIAERYPHAAIIQAQKARNEFRLIFGPA
jgi:Protein of unknown function (DUF2971)